MQTLPPLFSKLKQKLFSNQLIRNLSWLGLSEMILRICRLGVVVVLARFLTAEDYGLVAIVMTVFEFIRVLSEIGCSAKIIQADEEDLAKLCNSAFWLNWAVFLGLFIIQCLVAFPVAWFYSEPRLILPVCVSGLYFLIVPFSAVQYALIHRENRLQITAISNTAQYTTGYILSAIFAVMGMGMWSIVLSGVVSGPIGVYVYYRNHSWRPTGKFTTQYWGEILGFGKNILGVQLLRVLRNNFDYLLVGRFLGLEQLGVYYFAFNAGLGISLSIINALNSAVLPHLCEARTEWSKFKERYFSSLKTIALIIIPIAILQSGLAPIYVPIVFGQKWAAAIPILMLICLSAIPRPFADAASQMLVAVGRPDIDFRWNIIFTSLFAAALLIGVQEQAVGVALAVLLVHLICLPLFVVWASRRIFSKA